MKRYTWILVIVLVFLGLATGPQVPPARAAQPVILGVPTSIGFLEGKEGLFCVNMAVDEINKAGGVNVGGVMRPFKVIAIDARGAEPGVPVAEVIKDS